MDGHGELEGLLDSVLIGERGERGASGWTAFPGVLACWTLNTQEALGCILETTEAISLLESVLLHLLICPPAGESRYLPKCAALFQYYVTSLSSVPRRYLGQCLCPRAPVGGGAVLFPHVILEAAEVTEVG